jgi:hypothetical protein
MRKLELLNSEGAILIASKSKFFSTEELALVVTFKNVYRSYIMTLDEFTRFLDGEIVLYDGAGKEYIFPEMPRDMKPAKETIEKFLS